ncbi:MAG: hypothetical protein HFG36_10790 [Eubacterium sp.]|nr:hypothetical protein [Eubacterium sp.]
MLLEDYISEGGARIKVYDDALDNSPENRERIYNNLSRIVTDICIKKYKKEINGTRLQEEETNV